MTGRHRAPNPELCLRCDYPEDRHPATPAAVAVTRSAWRPGLVCHSYSKPATAPARWTVRLLSWADRLGRKR